MILSAYYLVVAHQITNLSPQLYILSLEIAKRRQVLQPPILLLLKLPYQRLNRVPILMLLLPVPRLLISDPNLTVLLHSLYRLVRLDHVVRKGSLEIFHSRMLNWRLLDL